MSRNSSAELSILFSISELARRCGIRPADADALIDFDIDRQEGKEYRLSISYGAEYSTPGMVKFRELMDMTTSEVVWASDVRELEDRVEEALSLAPRARVRGGQ